MTLAPICECHGVSEYWAKDARRIAGGYWRCRVQRISVDAKHWQGYAERMPTLVRLRKDLARDRCGRRAKRAHRKPADNPKLVQALISVRKGD